MSKRILIIGHMQHGKDTLAEMLYELFGYTFESSSIAAARIFLYDVLKDRYGYASFMDCYHDRVNHRPEWHDLICEFNREDKARLAKEILKDADIYVGMRSHDEIVACKEQGLFDLVVGVYDPRKKLEPQSSFSINLWEEADVVIPNAGTISDLERKIFSVREIFLPPVEVRPTGF